MKRFIFLVCLIMAWASFVLAVNYSEFPPLSGAANVAYSPNNFTATLISPVTWETGPGSKLSLSGGNIATYTTAECLRVTVFRSGKVAAMYDPAHNEFRYSQPTLEVINSIFSTGDAFRVEFIDPLVTSTESTLLLIKANQTNGTQQTKITDGTANIVSVEAAGGDAKSNTLNSLSTAARILAFNGTTWDRVRVGVTTESTTITGVNTLPWAVYNATPRTRSEAQGGQLQANTTGDLKVAESFAAQAEDNTNGVIAGQIKPLAVNTYSYTLFSNFGTQTLKNVKSSAGNVYSLIFHNKNIADRYVQLHNTATVPSSGGVPLLSFLVAPSSEVKVGTEFFGSGGMNFSTGIAFAISTTEATFGTAEASDQVTFIGYN